MRVIGIVRLIIVLTLFVGGSASAWAFPITIEPGAYTGRYIVSGTEYHGTVVIELASGSHNIDTGASLAIPQGTSYFEVNVDPAGQVASVINPTTRAPSGAAVGLGTTLAFNNATVTFNPTLYTGRYFIASHGFTELFGPQTVVLVPDLVYYVDNGSFIATATAASDFLFLVDPAGQIAGVFDAITDGSTVAAVGSANTVTFSNVLLNVDPGTFTGVYSVAGNLGLSGITSIVALPGLLTNVVAGLEASDVVVGLTTVTPSSVTLAGSTFTLSASLQGASASFRAQVSAYVASGAITSAGFGNGLSVSVRAAVRIAGANPSAAVNILQSVVQRIQTAVTGGRMSAAAGNALVAELQLLIAAL